MYLEILIALIFLYFIFFCIENFPNSKNPPGPVKVPPFGTLIQIRRESPIGHVAFNNLAKKYGDVMSVKLGFMDTVLLSSFEAVKEVLSKEETVGKQCVGIFWDRNFQQNIGLGFSNGAAWTEMRTFCRNALRQHGFGDSTAMKNILLDEISELLRHMEVESKSDPQRQIHFTSDYFHKCFSNIMATMVMGKRFDYNDKDLQHLLKYDSDVFKNGVVGTGILLAYPFLRHIFPKSLGYKSQMKGVIGIRKSAINLLNRRRKEPYHNDPRCFTDEFLKKIDEEAANPESLFTEQSFQVVFSDIMQSGTNTTSTVVVYTILFLTCSQDVQERIHREILNVIGRDRYPDINDKTKMPYTQSVILEVLRWGRLAPLGFPITALDDFMYRGYLIKKEVALIPNFYSVFFDEEFWGDPYVFKPERFLTNEGTLDSNQTDRMIAFGIGKRNCFGEVIARFSMFLFITSLIQKFKFELPSGFEPNLEPIMGIVGYPHPFDAHVRLRNND